MQKPLNTPAFALYSLWQRMLLNRKAGLLAGLTLLLLTGLISPAKADNRFTKNFVTINGQKYYTTRGDDQRSPPFTGITAGLGRFDRSQTLPIDEAESNTVNDNGYDVGSVQLLYRVYRANATKQELDSLPFTPLALKYKPMSGDNLSNNKNWLDNTTRPNLLDATSGPGDYILELFFQGEVTNTSNSKLNTEIQDNNGGNNYKTTFIVSDASSPPAKWLGKSTNWFDDTNWSTGRRPDPFTDVTIPFVAGSRTYPIITDPTNLNRIAQVRTLLVEGNNTNGQSSLGARLTLRTGELQIFGNFLDQNGGFVQSPRSVFTLAGVTQSFDDGFFTNVKIQGGGTKTLTGVMDVTTLLQFQGAGGILVTRTDNPVRNGVVMELGAQLVGESESSYVFGLIRSTKRAVDEFQTETFSGIGIELTAEQGIPGGVIVIRRTFESYRGVGTSRSITRSFTFSPENTDELNYSLKFHYRDAELGSGTQENSLVLFSSDNGNSSFNNLGRTEIDQLTNILTRTYIQQGLAGLFTLGDRLNPLPVTVTSFTAVAQGADAVLDWATATEKNSQGFEVQVSTDARTYRKLGFVTSTANSSTPRSYQYRDATAGKTGTRYYRLRQLDLDGKEAFIGPKAVAFGAPTVASVQGYPNPFGAEINLELQAIAGGPATVSLLDGLGRQVRSWQPTLAAGASRLSLPGLQSLARGLYVVQVRYSDGQTQRLKLVKE